MTDHFRITLGQLNPTVGDLDGNAQKARKAWAQARAAGASLLALPEMFITGHPAHDLLLRPAFVADATARIEALAQDCAEGPAIAIGGPAHDGRNLFNAYYILERGKVAARILKHRLTPDSDFAQCRLFTAGPVSGPYRIGPIRIGSPIGEDALTPEVAETLAETGAEIMLVPDASPYYRARQDRRMSHMVARVVETGLPLVYLNAVGGQDDHLFDGAGFVLNPGPDGGAQKAMQLAPFDESVTHLDFQRGVHGWRALPGAMHDQPDEWEQDYRAMTEGLRDYMRKSGFRKVVLGLSGGIDSALVAAIACDAIGPENVRGVMLPSEYTSAESLQDASDCAARLGIRLDSVPIDGARAAVTAALAPLMAGTAPDTTEENIQSRLRGVMLMAISNKFNELLLTTGNKSEVAVGYSTIYGDMAGGYNPIKDLYKTRVFQTCRWRNIHHRGWMLGKAAEVVPPRVISKPPSAELRPDQTDQDSLPPYEVLDAILEGIVEKGLSVAQLVTQGFAPETVLRVQGLIYASEWKRQQAAPGPCLTPRAFGTGRHYPLVNRWRDRLD